MELSGELREQDFSGMDLRGVVFRRADLYRCCFACADLAGAVFDHCFAAEADFSTANCPELQAHETSFYRANFTGANLREALLWRCVLAGADLRGADLKQVTVTLDCNSFEEVLLDRAASVELAYLFGRARTRHRLAWLEVIGPRDLAWLARVFAR